MLLINIQRARAQYNDMLTEAEARRRAKPARLTAWFFRRPKRDKTLTAFVLDVLRRGRKTSV
jgi:hypothetical protein